MNSYIKVILSAVLPFAFGCLLIVPVINSENGYVAGFVFLPLFLIAVITSTVLFILGFVMLVLNGRPALWWLAPGPLVFIGFFGIALIAKQFEIGAYKEQPMVSFDRDISNYVIFKRDLDHSDITHFWKHVISTERSDGRGYESLPGIQTMGNLSKIQGREAMLFNCFENATEEQRQYVYERVRSSPHVEKLLENSTKGEFEREIYGVSSSITNVNSQFKTKTSEPK
jgi:hypothetical protein